jgi:hypothetical protein
MKHTLILTFILVASPGVFAQEEGNAVFYGQSAGPVTSVRLGAFEKAPAAPIQGAPYSAAITNESIETLSDGNRIVQTSSGTTARDSQGRTRQDAALPAIGNLSAANAPHLVFIQDPVAQTSYTLNLTDKTAQKIPAPSAAMDISGPANGSEKFLIQKGSAVSIADPPPPAIVMQRTFVTNDQAQVSTEDLGSQTMEGILVSGVRTTHTIPAGQIGNDKPISIVTEVWTSPDLKTIVYSKRSDPRMGEQTFQLKNIVRTEPDASLFTVPADFTIIDGPQKIIYRSNQ